MERDVRLGCVVAIGLWVVAVLLTLSGTIAALSHDFGAALALLAHGILAMGAAATMTVRNLFDRQRLVLQDAILLNREARRLRAAELS